MRAPGTASASRIHNTSPVAASTAYTLAVKSPKYSGYLEVLEPPELVISAGPIEIADLTPPLAWNDQYTQPVSALSPYTNPLLEPT